MWTGKYGFLGLRPQCPSSNVQYWCQKSAFQKFPNDYEVFPGSRTTGFKLRTDKARPPTKVSQGSGTNIMTCWAVCKTDSTSHHLTTHHQALNSISEQRFTHRYTPYLNSFLFLLFLSTLSFSLQEDLSL